MTTKIRNILLKKTYATPQLLATASQIRLLGVPHAFHECIRKLFALPNAHGETELDHATLIANEQRSNWRHSLAPPWRLVVRKQAARCRETSPVLPKTIIKACYHSSFDWFHPSTFFDASMVLVRRYAIHKKIRFVKNHLSKLASQQLSYSNPTPGTILASFAPKRENKFCVSSSQRVAEIGTEIAALDIRRAHVMMTYVVEKTRTITVFF